MSSLWLLLIAGFYSACFLFLASVGLTLIFGVGNFFNFAHGAFFMLGGFCLVTLNTDVGMPFVLAVPISAVAVGLLATVLFHATIRPALRVKHSTFTVQIIASYGLMLVLAESARLVWGSGYVIGSIPQWLALSTGTGLSRYHLVLIGTTVLVGVGATLLIHRTRFGRMIRAVAADPTMAAHIGVSADRVLGALFGFAACAAALGGALAVPMTAMTPFSGSELIVSALIVTIVGGRGSILGAAIASLLIAEIQAFGVQFAPRLAPGLPFLIAAVVIAVRPYGLQRPTLAALEQRRV